MWVSLVLLWFCLSGVQFQKSDDKLGVEDVERSELNTSQTTLQLDVWAELKELRDMVVEQRAQLQHSQGQFEELKKENGAINTRLLASESQVEKLKQDNSDMNNRLLNSERQVEELKVENTDTPKVAFSSASGLNGYLGPLSSDVILVFSKEITNIGNAFSPITGVFTAPLRGVYYFRFSIFSHSSSDMLSAFLFKNQEFIFNVSEQSNGSYEYASNAVTLLLEKGDLVYVKLRSDRQVYDDSNNHSIFSGFLLFSI